jgi:uridine kinase
VIAASLAAYEASLDEAAQKVVTRLNAGDKLRMMWVSGPSSSGKTTTTVKLTERLKKHGLRFLMLNLDDYFWSLIEHPDGLAERPQLRDARGAGHPVAERTSARVAGRQDD